jgi:NAD(P)-dependent dehydrogenase (short-subunit alcohol dehydrogenase family)/acyl carrier protein
VTCGAQRIAGETPDAAQAAAWGVGRVAAVEMPDSFGGLVDLDPAADVAQRIADLVAALAPTPLPLAECEVAYRAGGRYVPRLEAANVVAAMPTFHADGYYVVTGGLGGVGLVVAAWLAERGARRLVLVGRTPLPSRDRWDDAQLTMEQQRRIAGVRRVEASGAEVCIGVLEVSDARSVGTLVDERRRDGWGNARGIVHCATDVQFGLLHDASRDDVAAMMRAKVGGADVLLSAFDADAPDFYVMFSSLGALLGDRGQGTYAAANAVLDSWAIAQRGQGRPVSVVNWGAWEGTGLAATRGGELVVDTLQRRGVLAVPPQCATTALGAVLSTGMPQAVVFRRGGHVTKETGRDPWRALVGVSGEPEPIAAEVAPSSTAAIRELVGSRERLRKLTAVVHEIVADTLGLADTPIDVDRPLGTLGMDSLMAIRIRRRCERLFELSLPATTLFSYPTLGALSGLLFERLALSDELTLAPVIPDVVPTGAPAAAPALSDDDALAALRGRRPSRRSST